MGSALTRARWLGQPRAVLSAWPRWDFTSPWKDARSETLATEVQKARQCDRYNCHDVTMQLVIAAASLVAPTLVLALWPRRAPPPNSQHAALSRLIDGLDTLDEEYALAVDENGALAVLILQEPPIDDEWWLIPDMRDPNNRPSFRERLARMNAASDKRMAWFSRFHAILDAEADEVDSYLLTKDHGGLYPVDSHCAEDVLAAGLSARPGRFASRAAAREWFPSIMDYERRPEQVIVLNDEDDPWKNLSAAEWHALQYAELRTLLDRLDSSDMIYELGITDQGHLAICPFDTNRFADELSVFGDARSDDSWKQLTGHALSVVGPSESFAAQHVRDFDSPAWRALQRADLQARLDRTDPLYELSINDQGDLIVTFPEFADERAEWEERIAAGENVTCWTGWPSENSAIHGSLRSSYIPTFATENGHMYRPGRVQRRDGGRGPYSVDDIFAAGLGGDPGLRPMRGWRSQQVEQL